jgi:hypothetical protein
VNIRNIKGLKFPDEYFIKFFFKYNLFNLKKMTFLELGCSNGCNLMLPYQYDFEVIGVDLDNTLISYANENFSILNKTNRFTFILQDMRSFCDISENIYADILVLANSVYYISKSNFILLLKSIKKNQLIKKKIPFFIRYRGVDDFRYGKGEKVEEDSFILENRITGEDGVYCTFYNTEEMVSILKNELNLREYQIMNLEYENIQHDTKVKNSDVVIWGTIN